MDQIIRVAEEADVAVVVVHHVAKGTMRDTKAGDPADAARGASAIVNRARIALSLRVMDESEADKARVPREKRYNFVQVVDAKANLTQRQGYQSQDWIELDTQRLQNGDADYPEGDKIGVPVKFEMMPVTPTDIEAFIKVVAFMRKEEELPAKERRCRTHFNSSLWVGRVIADACGLFYGTKSKSEDRNPSEQAAFNRANDIINELAAHNILVIGDVMDNGKKKPLYRLADGADERISAIAAALDVGDE